MKTSAQLTRKEIEAYCVAAQRQEAKLELELQRRKERAWALARQASALLREEYGAARIVVFGSLARDHLFTLWSDVDIAAWGLRPEDTFRAIGNVYDLDPEIPLNLVDPNAASPSLVETILKEGIEI